MDKRQVLDILEQRRLDLLATINKKSSYEKMMNVFKRAEVIDKVMFFQGNCGYYWELKAKRS